MVGIALSHEGRWLVSFTLVFRSRAWRRGARMAPHPPVQREPQPSMMASSDSAEALGFLTREKRVKSTLRHARSFMKRR